MNSYVVCQWFLKERSLQDHISILDRMVDHIPDVHCRPVLEGLLGMCQAHCHVKAPVERVVVVNQRLALTIFESLCAGHTCFLPSSMDLTCVHL